MMVSRSQSAPDARQPWLLFAWRAVGAHGALWFSIGAFTRGGILDVTWTSGNLVLGPKASGAPTWLAAGVAIALAFALPALPGLLAARRGRG